MAAFIKKRKRSGRQDLMSEINVTPLVDVMLVLLIVFMVTSPMLVAGVNVDLPSTSASPIVAQEEPLSLTIDYSGKIYIHNTPISLHDLGPKLKAITNAKIDSRIYVRGDKNVDYGKVMQIVSVLNEVGYEKVSLVTDIKPTK